MLLLGLAEWLAILAVTYGLSGQWVNSFMVWLADYVGRFVPDEF